MNRYLVNRKMNVLLLAGVVVVLLLAGCAQNGQSTTQSIQPATLPHVDAIATLNHVPVGSTVLNWNPTNHVLVVSVKLTGLAPSSTHPAHIYEGACSKQGKALYPLQNIVADTHGVGAAMTTIDNVASIPDSGWSLAVHNGPGLVVAEQALPIVCGNISHPAPSNKNAPQQITVNLNSAPSSSASENARGTVKMALANGTLTVVLNVSGLQPNSSHAAHIHSGSCVSQGSVVHPLKTVVANATGSALETTVIKNVKAIPASGWYVNVHLTTDMSTQTGFDPIACGNVTTTA
jgi:hypothetical protein